MVQAFVNIAAAIGATVGPLIIGALTRNNPGQGWRRFYVCLFILQLTPHPCHPIPFSLSLPSRPFSCALEYLLIFRLVVPNGTLGSDYDRHFLRL